VKGQERGLLSCWAAGGGLRAVSASLVFGDHCTSRPLPATSAAPHDTQDGEDILKQRSPPEATHTCGHLEETDCGFDIWCSVPTAHLALCQPRAAATHAYMLPHDTQDSEDMLIQR
jgi:hypothetical protein